MNETADHVLMVILPGGGFGLPGGHVELNEDPDSALEREVFEELGLRPGDYSGVRRADFWRDPDGGRILLGYVGNLKADTEVTLDPSEVQGIRWVGIADFAHDELRQNRYRRFITALISQQNVHAFVNK